MLLFSSAVIKALPSVSLLEMAAPTPLISLSLGILGNILSILVFSSPLPTFWRIFKRKSTEDFKGLPYICTLLSTLLWTYYGLIKPGGTLILTINAAGTVFQSFYLIVFLIYAPKGRKARTGLLAFLLDGVCFGVIFMATMIGTHGTNRVFAVGAICSGISVSMYASPLIALKAVVRTKSVEFMPFFLSLFLFLNGGVWSLYALLVKDVFVEVPNAIGFFLGGVQLALYVYYKNFGKPRKPNEEDQESFDGVIKASSCDVEMGRSASLPKHFSFSKQMSSTPTSTSIPKQHSLPAQILKSSSAKMAELLNFLQDNDPIHVPKHEDSSQGNALLMNEAQSSPRFFHPAT